MTRENSYTDRKGRVYGLATVAADELELIRRLQTYSTSHPDWTEYSNYWMPELKKFGDNRGITRRELTETTAYRVAQDIGSRLAIAQGYARLSDYRSELETLIHTKFRTQREFCEATGLSEDMLSHVLARRKNLSIDALSEALAQIGYTVHIMPLSEVK